MNLLPSLAIFSVPGHEEYTIIEMACLERVDRAPDGVVPMLWKKKFYVKVDLTEVDPADTSRIIATFLNTLSEQLEADDYDTYPLVTKDAAYGQPYVM